MISEDQKGVLLIVCGPSGVGKTSLCDSLLEKHDSLTFSVSYTTRMPREEETHGEDYYFIDEGKFKEMKEEGLFAEWAEVHNNFYGTSKNAMESAWSDGKDLIFDIDYQGTRQLKNKYPKSQSILVVPPDFETLKKRLKKRGSEDPDRLDERLKNVRRELSHYHLFDYIVENDSLKATLETMSSIYVASRHRRDLHSSSIEEII